MDRESVYAVAVGVAVIILGIALVPGMQGAVMGQDDSESLPASCLANGTVDRDPSDGVGPLQQTCTAEVTIIEYDRGSDTCIRSTAQGCSGDSPFDSIEQCASTCNAANTEPR